jgi:hypothetical protein
MLADAALVWTAIGAVAAVIAVGIGAWQIAQNRAAKKANAHEAEIALAGVVWKFRFELRPSAGDAKPTQPPVEIRPDGANVWVHAVRLSWRPSQPGSEWVTDDAECPLWRGDDSLPIQLFTTSRALELGWPGPNPETQIQLFTRLRVEWSATEKGPRHWREADSGSTNWQQPA